MEFNKKSMYSLLCSFFTRWSRDFCVNAHPTVKGFNKPKLPLIWLEF